MSPYRDILGQMIGAFFMAASALVVLVVIILLLVGCRQMPVLRGPYADDKVAQAKVDSRQHDRIADLCAIEEGMSTVLTVVVPEDVHPQLQAVQSKITGVKAKADAEAAQGRERADLAERDLAAVNASPGPGAWLGAAAGALGGNWSGLLDLVLGALGVGGAAVGLRARSKAKAAVAEVVDGVERFAEEDPKQADRLKVHMSSAMDRRTKDLVREAKSRRKSVDPR
jgi:hypothetical protein